MPQDPITEARTLIGRHTFLFRVNTASLGREAAPLLLTRVDVAFQVLNQLNDNNNRTATGYYMLASLSANEIAQVAATNTGLVIIRYIDGWLSNANIFNETGLIGTDRAVLSFQQLRNRISLALAMADLARRTNQTPEPRRLTDAEIDSYRRRAGRQTFNDEIVWELPESGTGFVAYNRNDVRRDGLDQIGTRETIDAIIAIAREWHGLHSDRILQIGDISRPGGLDTSQHDTHEDGKIFDMRPLRNDNQTGRVTWRDSFYSLDLTKEFIRLVRSRYAGTTVLFNDAAIHTQDRELSPHVNPSDASHDNHLHVMFPGGS